MVQSCAALAVGREVENAFFLARELLGELLFPPGPGQLLFFELVLRLLGGIDIVGCEFDKE